MCFLTSRMLVLCCYRDTMDCSHNCGVTSIEPLPSLTAGWLYCHSLDPTQARGVFTVGQGHCCLLSAPIWSNTVTGLQMGPPAAGSPLPARTAMQLIKDAYFLCVVNAKSL